MLSANTQRFDSEKLLVFPYGLSQESKTVTFAYYPNASIASTLHPGVSQAEREDLKQMILDNFKDLPPLISWTRWLPLFLRSFILDKKLATAFKAEQVTCQLKTVSEIIQEHNVRQISICLR